MTNERFATHSKLCGQMTGTVRAPTRSGGGRFKWIDCAAELEFVVGNVFIGFNSVGEDVGGNGEQLLRD